MQFPLSLSDITLWIAVMAMILLVSSELLVSEHFGYFLINKTRLRQAAIVLGVAFMGTVLLRVLSPSIL
jgi:hypothetical protein